MENITIVTFIEVLDSDGVVQERYQNGKRENFNDLATDNGDYLTHPDNALVFNGNSYYFLSFLYQGAAKTRSGDNLEAALVLANNQVSMNRARSALRNNSQVKVSVCTVVPETLAPSVVLTVDTWLAASLSYDATTVEILLSSAIDAVGSNAPNRTLTTLMVGALPTSGDIQNR